MQNIKNIIFDIGNVLIPLQFEKINNGFAQIMIDGLSPQQMIEKVRPVFLEYETGKITTKDFLNHLKQYFREEITNQEIIDIWKLIIGDFPRAHVSLLKNLAQSYRLFILSNTNELHVEKFEKEVPEVNNLKDLFERTYYSHLEGLRKPQMELYQRIIEQNNLNPSETLFVDDLAENLAPAKELGIQTLHVTPEIVLPTWFDEMINENFSKTS